MRDTPASASRSDAAPGLPRGVEAVREAPAEGAVPHVVHPGWHEALPWLAQGTTTRGGDAEPLDMAMFGEATGRDARLRWEALLRETGTLRAVHGHQVHGSAVRVHGTGAPGLLLVPATDGHVTGSPGVLLTVATADCVPVQLVDPERRTAALLHAGWRGVAAGILEEGVATLEDRLGCDPGALRVHLGPAICGPCYEVGAEVFRALGLEAGGERGHLDLRAVLAERAVAVGVDPGAVSVSTWCTRCHDPFFSHRGGDGGRQVTFLGRTA